MNEYAESNIHYKNFFSLKKSRFSVILTSHMIAEDQGPEPSASAICLTITSSSSLFERSDPTKEKGMKLRSSHRLLPALTLTLSVFFTASLSQRPSKRYCGKIEMQSPFFVPDDSTVTSPLNHMVLCRSQKLYFRTSLGLLPVSSIDYTSKTLTIAQPYSCSPSRHYYVSPSLLSAGFPTPPPQPNSLVLFNCSSTKNYPAKSSILQNCTRIKPCAGAASSGTQERGASQVVPAVSCLVINDLEKLDKGFHPKDLNCSHYSRVYQTSSVDDDDEGYEGYELGTRISFDIPDHVPDICNECRKPNGNCGIGLRCICHLQDCKDKVVSVAGTGKPGGGGYVLFSAFPSILVSIFFICY